MKPAFDQRSDSAGPRNHGAFEATMMTYDLDRIKRLQHSDTLGLFYRTRSLRWKCLTGPASMSSVYLGLEYCTQIRSGKICIALYNSIQFLGKFCHTTHMRAMQCAVNVVSSRASSSTLHSPILTASLGIVHQPSFLRCSQPLNPPALYTRTNSAKSLDQYLYASKLQAHSPFSASPRTAA